jgi:hypothetical protein
MPFGFRDRALKFLDSIMESPDEIFCNDPSGFQVSTISQTSAEFSWAGDWNSSSWSIYLDTLGFDTTGKTPILITDQTYLATNLSPNTPYELYIQTACFVGGTSSWVGPIQFKTFCNPVTAEYAEDFETNDLFPDCWFALSSDSAIVVSVSDSLSLYGNNAILLFNDSITSGLCGIVTPELIELGTVPIEVRFSARTFSDSSFLFLGTMENPLDSNSWTCFDTLAVTDKYEQYSIKFDTSGIENDRFIVLQHSLDSAYIFIDDFVVTTSDKKIDGYFNYYNNQKTPLQGMLLDLVRDSAVVANTSTDDSGFFEFAEIPNGNYTINVSTSLQTGGVNSLDAGKANLWWTSPVGIERIRWNAGDVDSSGSINATDAGMIQQHFVFGTSFPRGEWTFWKQNDVSSTNSPTSINNINVVNEPISQDFYGLCVGDFKGDFIPNFTQRTTTSDLILLKDGTLVSAEEKEVELQVKVTTAIQIAGLSLIFEIPSNLVSVKDVHLNNGDLPGFPLDFNVVENELKIGWHSSKPINFDAGTALITLTLQTTHFFMADDVIEVELKADPRNQLANAEFDALENVILSVPAIAHSPTSLNENSAVNDFILEVSPNPFQKSTYISYLIPTDGKVLLEVYNLNGICVKTLVDKFQKSGPHSIKYNTLKNEPGIYFVILQVKSKNKVVSRSLKIVKNPD